MDEYTSIELRKALDLLKAGDAKNARPILVSILKENPEIEQAWYMLSFAVSEYTKQKYALEQVLRINPENEKARARMAKISGETYVAPELASPPEAAQPESAEPKKEAPPEPEVSRDLFARRLGSIGVQPSDQPDEPAAPLRVEEEEAPPKKTRGKPKKDKKKKKKKKSRKKAKQASSSDAFAYLQEPVKRSRGRIFILLVALIILVILLYLVFGGGNLLGDLWQVPGGDPPIQPTAQTNPPTPTSDEGGRRLPPTWTPTVTETPLPTPQPSQTPTATVPPTS